MGAPPDWLLGRVLCEGVSSPRRDAYPIPGNASKHGKTRFTGSYVTASPESRPVERSSGDVTVRFLWDFQPQGPIRHDLRIPAIGKLEALTVRRARTLLHLASAVWNFRRRRKQIVGHKVRTPIGGYDKAICSHTIRFTRKAPDRHSVYSKQMSKPSQHSYRVI
jgi:hypothetical protein